MERKRQSGAARTQRNRTEGTESGPAMDARIRQLIRAIAEQAARDTLAASCDDGAVPPSEEGSSDD
jgi:hypothetical protein